jgi:hypothetical protein
MNQLPSVLMLITSILFSMLNLETEAVTLKNIAFHFKFIGKDSVRYLNSVDVELPAYMTIKELSADIFQY